MRLMIIRHADPDYPNNTITPTGHLEAKALAERMHREAPDMLFTSPLGRAKDTMEHTAQRLGKTGEVLDFTQEHNADWYVPADYGRDGKTGAWDVHGHHVRAAEPRYRFEDWHARAPYDGPALKAAAGELVKQSDAFLARFGYVREGGVYRVTERNELKLAVFCHGGFGLTWFAHLLEIPQPVVWSGFFMAPSSVTTILFEEREKGIATPRCLGFADISHLYAAGLKPQPRGILGNYY